MGKGDALGGVVCVCGRFGLVGWGGVSDWGWAVCLCVVSWVPMWCVSPFVLSIFCNDGIDTVTRTASTSSSVTDSIIGTDCVTSLPTLRVFSVPLVTGT